MSDAMRAGAPDTHGFRVVGWERAVEGSMHFLSVELRIPPYPNAGFMLHVQPDFL